MSETLEQPAANPNGNPSEAGEERSARLEAQKRRWLGSRIYCPRCGAVLDAATHPNAKCNFSPAMLAKRSSGDNVFKIQHMALSKENAARKSWNGEEAGAFPTMGSLAQESRAPTDSDRVKPEGRKNKVDPLFQRRAEELKRIQEEDHRRGLSRTPSKHFKWSWPHFWRNAALIGGFVGIVVYNSINGGWLNGDVPWPIGIIASAFLTVASAGLIVLLLYVIAPFIGK